VGVYLLAKGLVGKSYEFIHYKNLVVVQTHKYGWQAEENITFASLLKTMIAYPGPITIKNPWWMKEDGREKCFAIRRRIENYLESLEIPIGYEQDGTTIHRLMFA
jgi:hypothetical protein